MQSQSLVGTTQEIKKKYIPELGSDYPISTQVYDNNTNSILMVSHSEIELGNVYRVRYLQGQVTGFNKPHSGYFKVSRDFIDTKWTSKVDWDLDQQTKEHGAIKDNFKSWVITKSYFDLGHLYPDVVIGQITWSPAPEEDQDNDDDDDGLFFRDDFDRRTPYIITIQLGNDVTEYEPSTSLELTVTIKDDIWGIQASLSSRMEASIRNNTQNVPLNGDKQIAIGNTIYLRRDEGTTDEVGVIYLLGEKWTPELEFLDQSYEGWVHYEEQPENLTPPDKDFSVDFSDSYLEVTKNNYRTVDINYSILPVENNLPSETETETEAEAEAEAEAEENNPSDNIPFEPITEISESGEVVVAASPSGKPKRLPSEDIDLGNVPGIIHVNRNGKVDVLPPPAAGNFITTDDQGNLIEYSEQTLVQNINNLLQITFADNPLNRTVYSSGYIDNLPLGLTRDEINVLLAERVPTLYKEYVAIYGVEAPQVHTNYLRVGGQADNDSAVLVMNSDLESPKGFIPPRLTTSERNRIYSPTEGLTIYNEVSQQYEYYDGLNWLPIGASVEFTLNTTVIEESITLEKYGYFLVDTSNGEVDITLPIKDIEEGKAVEFIDLKGSILTTGATGFGLNKLNIHPNENQTIQGQEDYLQLDKDNEVIGLIYTQGDWRIFRRAQTGAVGGEGGSGGIEFLPINDGMVLTSGLYYFNDSAENISVFMPEDPELGDHFHLRNNTEFTITLSAGFNEHTILMPNRTYEFVYLEDRWSCTLLGVDIDYIWTIDHIDPPVIESYEYGTLSGTGQGDSVEIEINDVSVGSTSIDPNDGTWELQDIDLSEGDNTIVAIGIRNDLRETSEEFEVTKPAPPVITTVTDESIEGTAVFGYVVQFSINDTELQEMASVDLLGNWFLARDLDVGLNSIKVKQLNEFVESEYSAVTEYTVIPVPNEPTINTVDNSSITLNADPDIAVIVYKNDTELNSVDNDDTEEIIIDHGGLSIGENTFSAVAINSEGESSPETPDVIVNKPITPSIDSHNITSDTETDISGTGEADSTLKLFLSDSEVGETTTDENGNWSFSGVSISQGSNSFTAISYIGDIHSDTSSSYEIFLLRTPTIDSFYSEIDLTNNTKYFVTGTADSEKSVKLFLNGNEMSETGQADATGNWSIQIDLSSGPSEIKAKTFNNNTESEFSNAISKTVPSAPEISSYNSPNLEGTAMSDSHQLLIHRHDSLVHTLEDVSDNWSVDISGSIEASNNNYLAVSNGSLHSKLSNQFTASQITELIEITTEYNDVLGFDETIVKVINTTGLSGTFDPYFTKSDGTSQFSLKYGDYNPGDTILNRSTTNDSWIDDLLKPLELTVEFTSEDDSLAFTEVKEITPLDPDVLKPEFEDLSNADNGTSELKVINKHRSRALIQVNHGDTLLDSFELDPDASQIIDLTNSEYMGTTINIVATATVTSVDNNIPVKSFSSDEASIDFEVISNDLNMIQSRTNDDGTVDILFVNTTDQSFDGEDKEYVINYEGKRAEEFGDGWFEKEDDSVELRFPSRFKKGGVRFPFLDSNISITDDDGFFTHIATLNYIEYEMYFNPNFSVPENDFGIVPPLPPGTEITITIILPVINYTETKTFTIGEISISNPNISVEEGEEKVWVTNTSDKVVNLRLYRYSYLLDAQYTVHVNNEIIYEDRGFFVNVQAGDTKVFSDNISEGNKYFAYAWIGNDDDPLVVRRSFNKEVPRDEPATYGGRRLIDMIASI